MMVRWLRREARWLAIADDGALMRDHGAETYWEARRRDASKAAHLFTGGASRW